jgi:hemolysin III
LGIPTGYRRAKEALQILDHAAIHLAIAGSATPLALVVMSPVTGAWAVAVIWLTAVLGIVLKLGRWHHGDVVGSVLYAVVGAECAVVLPGLFRTAGIVPVVLAVVAGAIYAIGALCFGLKVPRLRAGVFGYHEVWHVATVAAAATHFAAVWLTVT